MKETKRNRNSITQDKTYSPPQRPWNSPIKQKRLHPQHVSSNTSSPSHPLSLVFSKRRLLSLEKTPRRCHPQKHREFSRCFNKTKHHCSFSPLIPAATPSRYSHPSTSLLRPGGGRLGAQLSGGLSRGILRQPGRRLGQLEWVESFTESHPCRVDVGEKVLVLRERFLVILGLVSLLGA